MKIKVLLSLLILSLYSKSQSNFSCKISSDEIKQPFGWHYVLGLNDGSSVLLSSDRSRNKFFMKHFNKEAKMILDTVFLESKEKGKNNVEISGVHEINGHLVFFLAKIIETNIKFYRFEIDPNNSKKISEEEIFNYTIADKEFIGYSDYTFDFTKNDATNTYYFLVLIKTNKDNVELKLNSYSYDHKKVSSRTKQIPVKNSSIDMISSIQSGNDYYFAVVYENPFDKIEKVFKKDIMIYKATGDKMDELPFKAENFNNIIGGQFSTNGTNIKLAISNSYTSLETFFGDRKSDTYLLEFSTGSLSINKKHVISHDKLISQYKDISKMKEKSKIHILNSPAAYFVNYANQDELIFHSYSGGMNGNTQWTNIDDLGIFDFNADGELIKSDIHPLKYELTEYCTNTFQYNFWEKGNSFRYYFGHPSALLFKHIEFLNYKGKTFIFYNDAPENVDITDISAAKELKKINQGIGMCLVLNKDGKVKKPLYDFKDQVYFDFASGSFNEKTGIYSVISYLKDNKVSISYISLN